jgi:multiple sugar transport system permease protein
MKDQSVIDDAPLRTLDHDHYRKATQTAELGASAGRFAIWVLLVVGSIAFMMPLYLMLTMALKTPGEIARTSAWSWPQTVTWDNFHQVLTNPNAPFFLFFRNTVIICTLSTAGVLASSSLVAYAFARLQFRGRDRLFIL